MAIAWTCRSVAFVFTTLIELDHISPGSTFNSKNGGVIVSDVEFAVCARDVIGNNIAMATAMIKSLLILFMGMAKVYRCFEIFPLEKIFDRAAAAMMALLIFMMEPDRERYCQNEQRRE